MKVGASRIVFTTDSFVVNPLRFPGGDIGSLAVNGTVNNLSVVGGQPIGLSAAFILEEGFSDRGTRNDRAIDAHGGRARRRCSSRSGHESR